MRLVCPNCAMKYEVPDDAIPEAGRDVQCANCGHGWYQTRPQPGAVPTPDPAPADSDPAQAAVAEKGTTPAAAETAAPKAVRAVGAVPPTKADASADPVAAAALAAALTDVPTRSVDEKVLAILREEAEREAKARREESQQLESPDGPAAGSAPVEPAPDPQPAPEPVATPEGQELLPKAQDSGPAQVLETVAEPAPLGDRNSSGDQLVTPLPDKTEKVATPPESTESPAEVSVVSPVSAQDAGADSPADAPPVATPAAVPDAPSTTATAPVADGPAAKQGARPDSRRRQGGFRAGFLLVVGVAILGAALYLGAEPLSRAVPALAGPLASYVDLVDGLRQGLDGLVQDARRFIAGGG